MPIMYCVRYLLFTFNLLFAIIGLAILVAGSLLQIVYHQYSSFVNEKFAYLPIVIIAAGAVIFIITFFGCCGTVKENLCMLSTFASLLLTIFIFEIIAAVGIFVFNNDLKDLMTEKMDSSLEHYDSNPEIAKSWDILQTDLQCCGVNGTDDWKGKIPKSCCPDTIQGEQCQRKDTYAQGCLNTIFMLFEQNSLLIAIIAAAIAFIQLVGVGFACCLAHSIHKGYETV